MDLKCSLRGLGGECSKGARCCTPRPCEAPHSRRELPFGRDSTLAPSFPSVYTPRLLELKDEPEGGRGEAELSVGCAGSAGTDARLRPAGRPGQSSRRISGFPRALERRRLRHFHPAESESGICEAAIRGGTWAPRGSEPNGSWELSGTIDRPWQRR